MYNFCTYFDQNYLVRGLTLYHSLKAQTDSFVLWTLCLDDFTYRLLKKLNLPHLRPVALAELEVSDPALFQAKASRSRVEYYFTCSPVWPLYLLNHFPEIDLITYLDADLYFYSDPAPIFEELGQNSILIIAHRFPAQLRYMESHGIYNVGLVSFRNDRAGRQALEWWRERCLEWCFDRAEDGKYGDQKYLDDWPSRFQAVVALQYKGANLAPWNWLNYKISVVDDAAVIDGQPLIFYHFHNLKLFNDWLFDPGVIDYGPMPLTLRRWLYQPYLLALKQTAAEIKALTGEKVSPGSTSLRYNAIRRLVKRLLQRQLMLSVNWRRWPKSKTMKVRPDERAEQP